MKKILHLLLVLCILTALLTTAAIAAETEETGACGENLSWSFDESTGTLTISGNGSMADFSAVWDNNGYFSGTNAPWITNGYEVKSLVIEQGVTTIGEYAFATLQSMQSVQLPASLTKIGWSAFKGCVALTTVDVPEGVSELVYGTFEGCSALTEVTLPESLTELGSRTFENCSSLAEITLPEGLVEISSATFSNCTALKEIKLPETLEIIETMAFYNCALTEIYIPGAVKDIAFNAFSGCKALEEINVGVNAHYWSRAGVLYTAVTEEKDYIEVVRVPSAYEGVLEIPEGVKYLGDTYVYEDCSELTEVHLPATVEGVESYANYNVLRDSTKLVGFYVDEANPYLMSTEQGVLYTKDQTELIACPALYEGSIFEIPETVKVVGTYAFNHCIHLTDIYIPASVESGLGGQTFLGCNSLTGLWVDEAHPTLLSDENGVIFNKEMTGEEPQAEKSILYVFPTGYEGYYEVPQGVTELYGDSFAGAKLNAIRLPESLERMSYWCLCWCENLDWVLFTGDKPSFRDGWLENGTATVYYPKDNATWSADPYALSQISFLSFGDITLVGYAADEEPVWPGLSEHEHSFGPWTVEKEPTASEEGLKSRTCTICGEIETQIIPVLQNTFSDVHDTAYYYEPVLWAAYNGITTGATETTFAPEETCTRAQIVTFLWRAHGQPESSRTDNPFVDIKTSDYFYKAVLWAVENGITTGLDATHFGPNEACTRGQVATFLWRAEGKPEAANADNPFEDIKSSDYYYSAVIWAVEKGVTLGTGEDTFSPNDACTRGQIVTFLYRACTKE